MSQCSVLRILDTNASMWSHMLSRDFGVGEDIPRHHLLPNPLPPSLSTLILHARGNIPSANNDLLHVAQMQNLLANHSERLPSLKQVFLSFLEPRDNLLDGLDGRSEGLEVRIARTDVEAAKARHARDGSGVLRDLLFIAWSPERNMYVDESLWLSARMDQRQHGRKKLGDY
jgi:hypothetical protein